MNRDLLISLDAWKTDQRRKPIILRGARQVGKTWLIEHFGKTRYKQFFSINFELQPHFKSCFELPDPVEIIKRIELTANISLAEEDTLLFLDEIQQCPEALTALRYFYEKMPGLSVIAAGSLLEFIHRSEDLSVPVGRVLNYYLSPLSFGEFLSACGEDRLRDYLRRVSITAVIPESIAAKSVSLLRTYLYTGGMPAAVADWLGRQSFSGIDALHRSLIQNYRQDFGMYGKKINGEMLEMVFVKAPGLVGSTFTYSSIDRLSHSREVRRALELLEKARLIVRIRPVSGAGLPLAAHAGDTKSKLLFLDAGLMQNAMGISEETYLAQDLLGVYRGAVTEQFVGQQLCALKKPFEDPELFYWKRKAPGSDAEVDYLYQHGETIIPVEVKSGTTGSLKSLRLFMAENQSPLGVRFAMHPLSFHDGILSIPLYAVEAMPNLINHVLI
jgi:predicted AAA+ superfamily ATPase